MADKKDPRANLASYAEVKIDSNVPAEYGDFYNSEPQEVEGDTRTWFIRGQNFVFSLTDAAPGAVLSRSNQTDEYVTFLEHEETSAEISWNDETQQVKGFSIVMIPAGDSKVTLPNGGRVIRLFTVFSEDLVAKCSNQDSYLTPKPKVAPYEPWPDPVGGWKIRAYDLNEGEMKSGFAKMYRNTNFMVNVLWPRTGPRDIKKLSPHSHDDFEQCSLVLQGEWEHSLRWQWGPDKTQWLEDEHVTIGAPSVCIIPAGVIHSSRGLSEGVNQLVDIFSPPRIDFSMQDGWVLNSDDYPMPETK